MRYWLHIHCRAAGCGPIRRLSWQRLLLWPAPIRHVVPMRIHSELLPASALHRLHIETAISLALRRNKRQESLFFVLNTVHTPVNVACL